MELNLLTLVTLGVPLLAVPAAVAFGMRRTVQGVLGLAALILIAPFVYFGAWAMLDGAPVWATLEQVSPTLYPLLTINAYMTGWAIAYAAPVAGVRWAVLRARAA